MPETKRLVEGSGGGGLSAWFVGGGLNDKDELNVENSPLRLRGPDAAAAIFAAAALIAMAMGFKSSCS